MKKDVKYLATKKKKRRVRKSFIFALLVLLLVVFVILLTTVLLPINKITVNYSGSKYKKADILSAAGIETGDNILMLSKGDVNKKVTEKLPYIGSVEIKKQLPDKVVIIPKETKAVYCIKYNKKYVLLNSEYKVLEIVKKQKKNLTEIKGLKINSCKAGHAAEFKNQDDFGTVKKLLKLVKKSNYPINKVDISSKFDIMLTLDNRFQIALGDTEDLTEKIDFMEKTLNKIDKKHKRSSGTLNLTYYSEKEEGYFKRGKGEEIYK